jgi:hypothetical protein
LSFEAGSGNVFADLGLDDSDELFARAKIGYHVNQSHAFAKLLRKRCWSR